MVIYYLAYLSLYSLTLFWILSTGLRRSLIEESWLSVSIRRAMYLLMSTLIYQGLERSSAGW